MKKSVLIVVILLVVVGALAVYLNQIGAKLASSGGELARNDENLALVSYVPNFINLQFTDLPMLTDLRGNFAYKNRTLAVGVGKIVDYDQDSGVIYRENSSKLDCLYSAAKVGNFLYAACNTRMAPENGTLPTVMYKIDLDSGKFVHTYNSSEFIKDPLVNLWLTTDGKVLWGSYNNGVFKLNPETDEVKVYTTKQLGYENLAARCQNPSSMYIENQIVKVPNWNCGGVSTYQPQTDSWTFNPNENPKSLSQTEQITDNTKLKLQQYVAISNIVAGKRYLLTNQALYTLKQYQFPIFNKNVTLNHTFEEQAQMYVTKNEAFGLLIKNNLVGMVQLPQKLTQALFVELLDLNTGQSVDLIRADEKLASTSVTNDMVQGMDLSKPLNFTEEDQKIIVTSPDNSKLKAVIDLTNKTLSITN